MKAVTRNQMKQIETNSLKQDLTFHRLMENAGSAAAAFIRRTFQVDQKRGLGCMVFCGAGNNGGDGLVVARKLYECGANVLVVLVDGVPTGAEASAMYEAVELMQLPLADFTQNREQILEYLPGIDILVDAMYGTGFHGELDAKHAAACNAINSAIGAVIALDIPTGVECDTGYADKHAVRADFTLAFDSFKLLHLLPQSRELCGQVELLDIGIPDEAKKGLWVEFGSLTTEQVFEHLPPRVAESHKGSYGKLLNIAGSARYRGAAALSTMGALRCGAGIVALAAVEPACAAVAAQIPEATFLPLAQTSEGTMDWENARAQIASELTSANAILVGCGLQNAAATLRMLEYVLQSARCPVVIDADGINALCGNIHLLKEARAPVVLTPHPGEMARLCGTDIADIQCNRLGAAMRFAAEHRVTLVLKGHETLTALPNGGVYLNSTGNPGLAKGGSGDVLAGMIGAFLAQGVEPSLAAACAVHLHGLAADETARRLSQYAMLPSELLCDLGQIFLQNQR